MGQVPVTDIEQHDPQAVIAGGLIELREFHRSLLHTPYTHHKVDSFIRLGRGHDQMRLASVAAGTARAETCCAIRSRRGASEASGGRRSGAMSQSRRSIQ